MKNIALFEENRFCAISSTTGFEFLKASGAVSGPKEKNLLSTAGRKKVMSLDFKTRRINSRASSFRQIYRNDSDDVLRIHQLIALQGRLELEGAGWHVAHHELFKVERFFQNYGTSTGNFFAPLPGFEGEIGLSEDWPFPAVFFTHPERGTVMLATLSQNRFKPVWKFSKRGRHTWLQLCEGFTGIPSLPVKPGETVEGEEWVALLVPGTIEDAIESYFAILRKRITFKGETSPLRDTVVWGSWNYNTRPRGFYDITHDMIVENARCLRQLVPAGKPVAAMIDDGYQFDRSKVKSVKEWFATCLEIFRNGDNPPHDPVLFPHGMKAVADAIRAEGVIPALWATTRIHRQCKLALDRPEWLLKTADGKGFGVKTAYLDYSIPEVREYTRSVWKIIFDEWGFEGMKLDFWSLPFEIPQVRYRNRQRTAVEWRNLFLQDLRDCMPEEAFVLICVVVNSGGNPFVGRYADAARMGADIGMGKLQDIMSAAHGLTTAIPFYRHDALLGDADSVGWRDEVDPGLNRLWNTTAFLGGAMCEIGGDLTSLSPDAAACLRLVADMHGPKLRTLSSLSATGLGGAPSERLVAQSEKGTLVGELNWTSKPRQIRLQKPARDLWTGKRMTDRFKIPPHDAVMYRI